MKGGQLFENYGQPNSIYFQFHGFILDSNSHNCVNFEFSVSDEENAMIDFSSKILVTILNNLRIKSLSALFYSACLSYPISSNVWLFLSVKMNTYEELFNNHQLGVPTQAAIKLLIDLISTRLVLYDSYSVG